MVEKKTVTFVDLFSGIGGFHLGIQQAAQNAGMNAECKMAVDIDDRARKTYNKNFPETLFGGASRDENDLTREDVKTKIPEGVDIICGGFPCQPFSLAGKKLGRNDHRGTLIEHIINIIREKQPKVVFLENVRNLLNIREDDGKTRTFDVIKELLSEAGYPIESDDGGYTNWNVYKASNFGVPTHRPRVYLVGFRKDCRPQKSIFDEILMQSEHTTLRSFFRNIKELEPQWKEKELTINGWPDVVGNTIRVGGVGSGYRTRNGIEFRDRRNWDSYKLNEGKSSEKIHQLTVHEAQAMMGFPHDFEFHEELSKNQRMRQLGNSVAVPVIRAISRNIIREIYGR